jgi:hypothetical protein
MLMAPDQKSAVKTLSPQTPHSQTPTAYPRGYTGTSHVVSARPRLGAAPPRVPPMHYGDKLTFSPPKGVKIGRETGVMFPSDLTVAQ